MIIGCAGELNQCFVFNFDQGFITKFSLLGILYPISPDQQFLVMDKFQSALLSIFKRRQSVQQTFNWTFLAQCPKMEENVATQFFSPLLLLSPIPAHICARFYPFNLFLPIIPFLPSASPQNSSPPFLTPLSHVFSTLSACVDDPSKCIVCPFMFCIFYSPAELLSCFFKIDFKIVLRRSHFIGLQKGCKHILLKLSPKNSLSTFI